MRLAYPQAPTWRARIARALVSSVAIVGVASCGEVKSNTKPDASGPVMADDAGIDAPPKACTETTCTNDVLEVCGSNGFVERTENCALGCFTDGTRCNQVAPSNGLASHLYQAAEQSDVTLPDGTTIDTDNGTVTGPSGAIAVATATLAQPNGPMLRVLMAKSFTIDNVRVTGTLPLALVAHGEIAIRGVLDASADGAVDGPGALPCTAGGAGGAPGPGYNERPGSTSGGYPEFVFSVNGAGGGGFGTSGGAGGVENPEVAVGAGGAVNGEPKLVPLRGGCPGYGASFGPYRGAGGGAVQLVSNLKIRLVNTGTAKGVVHVGGGGGHAGVLGRDVGEPLRGAGGGGSGGGILLEAPVVELDDGTALLAAGGGGGGYGACTPQPNGLDAPPNGATPTGGACPGGIFPISIGGNGATTGPGGTGGNTTTGCAGGGGGGLGRIRVNTADGQYSKGTNVLVLGAETTGTIDRH